MTQSRVKDSKHMIDETAIEKIHDATGNNAVTKLIYIYCLPPPSAVTTLHQLHYRSCVMMF